MAENTTIQITCKLYVVHMAKHWLAGFTLSYSSLSFCALWNTRKNAALSTADTASLVRTKLRRSCVSYLRNCIELKKLVCGKWLRLGAQLNKRPSVLSVFDQIKFIKDSLTNHVHIINVRGVFNVYTYIHTRENTRL